MYYCRVCGGRRTSRRGSDLLGIPCPLAVSLLPLRLTALQKTEVMNVRDTRTFLLLGRAESCIPQATLLICSGSREQGRIVLDSEALILSLFMLLDFLGTDP